MEWLTSDTACGLLGIKAASLYAYVSRGLVRAKTSDTDTRSSFYAAADIDQLLTRKRAGRKRDSIARGAIGWGEPILESAISTVSEGRLIFRGLDAIVLSQSQTLEQTASLLWGGEGLPIVPETNWHVEEIDPRSAGFTYLAKTAAAAQPCIGRSRDDLAFEAATLLDGLCHAMTFGAQGRVAHERLAAGWNLNQEQGDIVRRTLVLLADHELNPSTFAARVAASTGASLAASALAGFATLTGPHHGDAALQALDFLREAHVIGPKAAVQKRVLEGQTLSGLGHKLYRDGDPRAHALLIALAPYPLLRDAINAAEAAWSSRANIDMALAALTIQLGLPLTAPFTLFALARMAGWLAHAGEQGMSGASIRPRARYVGKSMLRPK